MGSLGWGGTDPLEITSLHHTRHPAEFGRSRSNGASAMEIHLIILNPLASRLSRSLRVTGTRRSVAYDFLLTFHSNCGPTSYRFRDKQRFLSKSQHQTAFRNQKLQWWGYQAEKKVWRYLYPFGYNTRVWRTPADSKYRAYAYTHTVAR